MNYIICGLSGAGRTTYCREKASYGDLILDVDMLFHAISGLPVYEKPESLLDLVLHLRDTTIDYISPDDNPFYNAWIITGGSNLKQRLDLRERLDATVIVLEVSPTECMRRIANDPRRADKVALWQDLVYRWWDDYVEYPEDVVIKQS